MYQSALLSLEFCLNKGETCVCARNYSVNYASKAFSYTCIFIQLFNCPSSIFYMLHSNNRALQKMYFLLAISMYQGTEIAFKNALFLGFFQIAKTRNLRAILTRSENVVLGNIFTSLCCNYDTKHTCKRSF